LKKKKKKKGNFQQGTSGIFLYSGQVYAQRNNVITVTVNYRLGALGWLVTKNVREKKQKKRKEMKVKLIIISFES